MKRPKMNKFESFKRNKGMPSDADAPDRHNSNRMKGVSKKENEKKTLVKNIAIH